MLDTRLTGLRVAVDVQHLYKPTEDRGAVFRLGDGTTVTEAHCATIYAGSIAGWLARRGADVLTNDPVRRILVGRYSARIREASAWGANAYLACHVNSGGGSYARVEYMAGTDVRLAQRVAGELLSAFPELKRADSYPLSPGARGAVCIAAFPGSAVLLEPFFGDTPAHQDMMAAPRLVFLGETIARAVADWWQFSRPVA